MIWCSLYNIKPERSKAKTLKAVNKTDPGHAPVAPAPPLIPIPKEPPKVVAVLLDF